MKGQILLAVVNAVASIASAAINKAAAEKEAKRKERNAIITTVLTAIVAPVAILAAKRYLPSKDSGAEPVKELPEAEAVEAEAVEIVEDEAVEVNGSTPTPTSSS